MKAIVLILSMILGLNTYAQTQTDIKNKNWYLTKLEIENQEHLRPVNEEANTNTANFYFEGVDFCWILFCYGYQMDNTELDEEEQFLFFSGLVTLAIPQECDLEENNDFDDLNYYFWSNREDDEDRDWYVNPLQFSYEIIGEGNEVQLIFTNESGDKAYYNDASASENVFEQMSVQIYPNPVQSTVNINLPVSEYQEVVINLYDITGKKLKTFTESWQENIRLDIDEIPAGNYLLELNLPENTGKGCVVKLIKE